MMRVTFTNGKRETHDIPDDRALGAMLKNLGKQPEIVQAIQFTKDAADKSSGPYPNNRQGRRRWERENRRG